MRQTTWRHRGGRMITPRVYLACLWGASTLLALYYGVAHRSAVAWWLLAALVPPLIIFVWWMVDRAALERRITRLEARSEIGDERRIDAHADLSNVEHQLHEIETRLAQVEVNKAGTKGSGVLRRKRLFKQSSTSVAGLISSKPEMKPGPLSGPGGSMAGEVFDRMRKRVLREHMHSIVRSAKNGHKTKGRGLVMVKFSKTGMVHLSYLTLDALKHQHTRSGPEDRDSGDLLIEKISTYSPDSEIPVMVTDGESERFSLGVKRLARPIQPAL